VPQPTDRYNTTDEGEFLSQQATDAKTAMQQTLAEIQTSVREAANVRWWTQQYPWYAVGAAAVAGFMTGTRVLVPPERQAAPAPPAQAQAPPGSSLTSSLFELVRSTLMSAIMEAVRTTVQPPPRPQTDHVEDHADDF
jgi:hypothetical protein